jgi:hypothetical protein
MLNRIATQDAKIEPERQPFALSEDVEEMKERLVLLERFINKLPPALTATSFAELGIEAMGSIKREIVEDLVSQNVLPGLYVSAGRHLTWLSARCLSSTIGQNRTSDVRELGPVG